MGNHVELSTRAVRDLRRIRSRRELARIERLLRDQLGPDDLPANVDVAPLAGAAPWMRVRVGAYRILLRRLTRSEMRELAARKDVAGQTGYLVERVVDRRDLERAVGRLP